MSTGSKMNTKEDQGCPCMSMSGKLLSMSGKLLSMSGMSGE